MTTTRMEGPSTKRTSFGESLVASLWLDLGLLLGCTGGSQAWLTNQCSTTPEKFDAVTRKLNELGGASFFSEVRS